MFGYLYGYTIPQLELMAVDQPLIVYDKKDKKSKGGSRDFDAPSKSAMDKAMAQYKEMQEKKKQQINETEKL